MVFDFRLRPPYKAFKDLFIFNPVCNTGRPHGVNARYTPSAHKKDMNLFLEEMKAAGIERGVVMGRGSANADGGKPIPNEDIRDIALEYPGKFIPFGGIEVSYGIQAALQEVERVNSWGFKGIAIEPGFCEPPRKADDATWYPVYARCEQLGLVVTITSSFFLGPDIDFCNPMYIQHVADNFPKLQIVVAHACYPWIIPMANILLKHPNIWIVPDMYLANPSSPGNQLYGDIMNWLQGERIIFGSAYPCYDMGQAVEDVKRFNWKPEYMEMFMHKNAEKLLGL